MTKKQTQRVEKALELISEESLAPGQLIEITRFEEVFGIGRNTKIFGILISEFRRALFGRGLYLSGEGSSESGCFEILDPLENQWVAKLSMIRAERDLTGKMTLLENTNTSKFSQLQKARHENTTRSLSLRVMALQRAEEVLELLKSHSSSLSVAKLSDAKPSEV